MLKNIVFPVVKTYLKMCFEAIYRIGMAVRRVYHTVRQAVEDLFTPGRRLNGVITLVAMPMLLYYSGALVYKALVLYISRGM